MYELLCDLKEREGRKNVVCCSSDVFSFSQALQLGVLPPYQAIYAADACLYALDLRLGAALKHFVHKTSLP